MNMITQLDEDKDKNKDSVVKIKANLKPILAHYKVKATCKVGRLVGRVRHGVKLDIKSSPFDFLGAYAAKNKGFDPEKGRLKLTANDDWSNWATGDMLKFLNATRDAIKDGFHDGFYDGVVTSVDHVDVTEYIEIHIGNFGTPYIIKEGVEMNTEELIEAVLYKKSYMVAEKIKELFEEKLYEKLDELQEEIVSEL